MAECASSCSWKAVALKGFMGALVAGLVLVSLRVLTHQEPSRGTF